MIRIPWRIPIVAGLVVTLIAGSYFTGRSAGTTACTAERQQHELALADVGALRYRTQALVTALSHLLRYSLMSNDEQVPLSREVRVVDEYYSIYHVRFGDRVQMQWAFSDSLDLTETMVPSFILQPIVENAFKHGICPKEEGGVVRIRINPLRDKGLLYISVCDNGVGIQPEQLAQLKAALAQPGERWEHIGIYNVAARLRLLDRNSRFVIRSHPGRGTAVVLYLPLVENEEEFEE